jgi:hypothetical protein
MKHSHEPEPHLNAAKRRHLVSAYVTIRHLGRQVEEAGRDGRSPSGVGAPLTPLAEDTTQAVVAPLLTLAQELRATAAVLAPAELAAVEAPQPPRSTLNWMSNLLDGVRAAVDNLQPGRMGKYGMVSEEEADMLSALHRGLFEHIRAAREALDREVGGV